MKMRLMCFNVNGIRARLHQLKSVINEHTPEIIGLQETKVQDSEFPFEDIKALGYHAEYFGQKGHYGVALLSKSPTLAIKKGFSSDQSESQKRFIQGSYDYAGETLHIINCYFPQGEGRAHPIKFPAKQKFYADLYHHIKMNFTAKDRLVVMGDMNVAYSDFDVGLTAENKKRWLRSGKSSFLPEEREWLQKLKSLGLTDTFRMMHGSEKRVFSWYDYRSRGFEQEPKIGLRIDLILISEALGSDICSAGIDVHARGGEKPSDHCPIWADIKL